MEDDGQQDGGTSYGPPVAEDHNTMLRTVAQEHAAAQAQPPMARAWDGSSWQTMPLEEARSLGLQHLALRREGLHQGEPASGPTLPVPDTVEDWRAQEEARETLGDRLRMEYELPETYRELAAAVGEPYVQEATEQVELAIHGLLKAGAITQEELDQALRRSGYARVIPAMAEILGWDGQPSSLKEQAPRAYRGLMNSGDRITARLLNKLISFIRFAPDC